MGDSVSLELDLRAGKATPKTTVWVRTATGIMETTMPRDAAVFLAGAGKPTTAIGVDGSIYLDTATATFYGPRTNDVWPPLGRLVNVPKEDQP